MIKFYMEDSYQYNYSDLSENIESMFDKNKRYHKAMKTISILKDNLHETKDLNLLDVGCSTGIMTNEYAKFFNKVVGIDIDEKAIDYAKENYNKKNLSFERIAIEKNSFDVITCSHIYEHVPNDTVLIKEIYNLLKPGGICYFAAGNKFQFFEPHYKLLFLSYFPKSISNIYLRLFRGEKFYYENHKSYKNLKKLVSNFTIIDYTLKIIEEPDKFFAEDMLKKNTLKYYFINFFARIFYFLVPTYIWLLKKNN